MAIFGLFASSWRPNQLYCFNNWSKVDHDLTQLCFSVCINLLRFVLFIFLNSSFNKYSHNRWSWMLVRTWIPISSAKFLLFFFQLMIMTNISQKLYLSMKSYLVSQKCKNYWLIYWTFVWTRILEKCKIRFKSF